MKKKIRKKNRKQSLTSRFFVIRYISIILIVGFFMTVFIRSAISLITNSSYFHIANIESTNKLSDIDLKKISYLRGKNIFYVDLKEFQDKLHRLYPDASRIRVSKRLPNQIFIDFTFRTPFARFDSFGQSGIIDQQGYIISMERNMDDSQKLPLITGFSFSGFKTGKIITSGALHSGIEIIEKFYKIDSLNQYSLKKVDVSHLSRIRIHLNQDLNIILDQKGITDKLNFLGIILARSEINQKQIQYIDLRFEEPVVKMK